MLILFITAVLASHFQTVHTEVSLHEGKVISACLERFGGMTYENAERLQRYKEWADNYEEFPCFTNCYLDKLGQLYSQSAGFKETEVILQFGITVYKACQRRLSEGRDACDIAYTGFHCLVTMQDDPFVLIESMPNVTAKAKTVMSQCLSKFEHTSWNKIKDYAKFPTREPIPCFSKCFVDNLSLLNSKNRHWNIPSLQHHLNIPAKNTNIKHCRALMRRRKRNACNWIFKELTCFVKA